jgi:outer membrane receptor protein involved in Fe transport
MKLRSAVIAAVLCLFSVLAVAQRETGTISGTVTDTTGATVAKGTVTVKSTTTGVNRTASTNQSGLYSVPDLQPGIYEVTIEASGFATYKGKVEVSVGSAVAFNAALKVGSKTEIVEVTAGENEVTKVNTENQTLSTTITAREVVDLPSLTRNPYDFVKTSGNVTEGAYGAQGMLASRGAGVSINGQRAASTDLLLDGAENVDIFGAGVGQNVPLDSVQEFTVLTSNFTAEYGRASGGIVNVATKAGTNALHGTGYEFNRVSALASNTPDNNANGLPKGTFTRNQFGYSVGGPIKKDKLFFFSSTEWTRIRSQQQQIFWVPDPAFIALSNANTQSFFSSLGHLRSGLTTLGSKSAGALGFGLVPASTPVFDEVAYGTNANAGAGVPQNTYSMVNRVDYNFTDRTNMYVRYAYSNEADFLGTNNTSPYAGYDSGASQRNHNALVSMTHVFSPTLVSDSKLSFNRFFNFQPLGTAPVSPTLYFQSTTAYQLGGQFVVGPGYAATTPGNAIPFGGPQNLIQLSQDFSWTRSKHQFHFGAAYLNMRDNRTFGAFENAVENLSTNSGTSTGLTNLFNGVLHDFQAAVNPQGKFPCPRDPTTGAVTTDPTQVANCTVTLPIGAPSFSRNNRYNDGSIYAQDEWKFRHNLTLNAGLRWEYFGVQHDANPAMDSNFYFGSANNIFDRIRTGQISTVPNSPNKQLWNPGGGFAPRVGFAWDPFGSGKTSIRGGYGLSYERNFGNVTFNVIQNPPNYFVLGVTAADLGAPIAISANNAGPLSGTGSKELPRSTGRIVDPNIPTSYAEFWSLGVQRELAKNTLFSMEYAGSNGIHLYDISNINQTGSGGVYQLDPNPLNRLDPQYGNLNYRSARGFSRYNALNIGLRSSNLFNKGLQFNMNYTWSHAIDNLSTTFSESTNNANLGYLDPFNPGLDKGNADFDSRHRVVASAIWDVPWLKNAQNAIVRQAFGGWSFAPIFNAYTGNPYTMYDCTNTQFVRCPRMFADTQGSSAGNTVAGPNVFNWFNTPGSAFPMMCDHIDTATGNCVFLPTSYFEPITGTGEFPTCSGAKGVGCKWPSNMLGRNSFRGPGFWNADMGIYKKIKLTERFSMQVRGEMYNMFNHHPYAMIGGNNDVSVATFEAPGTPGVTTAPSPSVPSTVKKIGNRDVQLGVKIIF